MAYRPKWRKGFRRAVYERDGFACTACGWQPPSLPADLDAWDGSALYDPDAPKVRQLELDHIVPHSKGGATTMENIQTLCTPCNCSKHDRDDAWWRAKHPNGY